MTKFSPNTLLFVPLLAVVACGDIRGAIDYSEQRDEFVARRDLLDGKFNTAFSEIPDTGTSTFRGEASLAVGSAEEGVALIGDAEITVDFGTDTASGQFSNFGGFDNTREYSAYTGVLTLEDGAVGVDRPNDLEARVSGTLTGEDYSIGVDAEFGGDLRGTPIVGVRGVTNPLNSTFELDGQTVPGGISVAVTN